MRYLIQCGANHAIIDNSVTAAREARTEAREQSRQTEDVVYIYQELAPSVDGGIIGASSRCATSARTSTIRPFSIRRRSDIARHSSGFYIRSNDAILLNQLLTRRESSDRIENMKTNRKQTTTTDDATLIKALKALAQKMPATAKDLGAGRGYAAHIRALESKGWIYCDSDYMWRPTVKGISRMRDE